MAATSGFNTETAKRLLLDAGAFFKNYDIDTDTGTLIGATRGGGEFVAKPTIRQIEVDGVKGRAKGLEAIDAWEVSIKLNLLEHTPDTLAMALATGNIDTTDPTYNKITAANHIALDDYIDNIAWIGRISGSETPVIIQIFNALSTEGVTLTTADKAESVLAVTLMAHYDTTQLEEPPFAIYYPKMTGDSTAPTLTVSPVDAATDVAVGSNIIWTFSEAIHPSSVKTGNFFVFKGSDGTLVPGTLALNADGTIVTFDPTSNLSAATAYIAIATTNVRDIAGNPLAAQSVTNFTTA